MSSYPLIKTKWSNMRVMTLVFLAAVLYMLPGWIQDPGSILNFAAVLAMGLVIDTAANFFRYKRMTCAVSAAVTVSILFVLSPGVPLWGQIAAITVALVAGKHIWGGTGKNPVNPAILGLLFTALFFNVKTPAFTPSLLLLPAIIVSLTFIVIRPFAALEMIAGMLISLLINQSLSVDNILSYGVIFWGCLVITDPVTISSKPWVGAIAGLLAGFLPMYLGGSPATMAIGVLSANVFSFAADAVFKGSGLHIRLRFKKNNHIHFSQTTAFYDMTGNEKVNSPEIECWAKEDILERIEKSGVYGFGGAAFPAIKKINTAIESKAGEYHLIINGVECDPGLIHDKWLLHNNIGSVVKGIRLVQKCLPFKSVTVAVKHAEGLNLPKDIAVHQVRDYYPAGAEKILIKEVLKKKLLQGSIPAREGILVLNVQTMAAIYDAVCLDRKADTRLITIADTLSMSGSVARVSIGANIREVAEKIFPGTAYVFSGGGIMNARIAPDDAVMDESVNYISVGMLPNYNESPLCSKCGYCSAVCPAGLDVQKIARMVDEERIEMTVRLHPETCMECGSCSHVCLAGRNLAARVRTAKALTKM